MTFHEQAAESLLDSILLDPGAAAVLAKTRQRFATRDVNPDHVAHIGQTQRGPRYWTPAQAAAYLKVHADIGAGNVARVRIEVGEGPGPDADREGNAARLAQIAQPFAAEVDMGQNGADQDGFLSWDQPIKLEKSTGTGWLACNGTNPVIVPWTLKAGNAPLEIGSTLPSRTMAHLDVEGAVARWPYGSKWVHLLWRVNRWDHGL